MNNKIIGVCAGILISVSAYSLPLMKGQVVDMSYPFDNKTIYWPTEKGFNLTAVYYGMRPDHYFYSAYKFCGPEHGGTHIDAPRHFSEYGPTVDQIRPEQLIGSAVVIDVTKHVKNNKDYEISVQDIKDFEKKYRPLSSEDIVLFNTGWAKFWPNKKMYLGTDKFGDVNNLHFPGVSKEAAQYLVQRHVKGIGLDTASMDAGKSKEFWTHRILLGAKLFGLENLTNIDLLPPVGATIIAAPMKIAGGSGGPTRVFAVLNK